MGKVKCKALHQTIPSSKKNSMKGKRTRFKQKKPPLKKSSSRKGKMKELLVKKKTQKETQGKIEPPQTRSTTTKGKLLNHSASDADTKIEDVISMHLQVKESSTAQIFPTGVFSTQLENDEKECLLSVIDITPDGKIVVLDSNNATLKIYDSAFQYQSSFKFLITKENCVSRYGIEAMAMLSNEEVMVCVFDESMGTKFHILDISEDKPYIKSTAYAQDIEVKAMTSCQNKIFIAGVYSQKHKLPFVNQIDQHGTMIWNTDLKEDRGHPTKIHMCCMVRNDHLSVLVVESQHASKIRNYDGATGKLIFEVLIADRGDIACITFGNDCIYVCFPHAETIDVYNSGFGLFKTVKFGGDPPLYMKYCELHALLFVSNTGAYPHVIDKMNILELKGHTYY